MNKEGRIAIIITIEACTVFALGVLGNEVAELIEMKPVVLIVGTCVLLLSSIVLTLLRAITAESDPGHAQQENARARSVLRTVISLSPVGMLLGLAMVDVLSPLLASSAQDFLYDYILVGLISIVAGALFAILIVAFAGRRRGLGKVTVLKGTQQLYRSDQRRGLEVEVFYPKPFKNSPNLTIRFPKKRTWGVTGVDRRSTRPEYRIIEQRPDGFVLSVLSLGLYEPQIQWIASGQLKD